MSHYTFIDLKAREFLYARGRGDWDSERRLFIVYFAMTAFGNIGLAQETDWITEGHHPQLLALASLLK